MHSTEEYEYKLRNQVVAALNDGSTPADLVMMLTHLDRQSTNKRIEAVLHNTRKTTVLSSAHAATVADAIGLVV